MPQFSTLQKRHRLAALPFRIVAPNEPRRRIAALENRIRAAQTQAVAAGMSPARFHEIVQNEIRSAARGKKGKRRR